MARVLFIVALISFIGYSSSAGLPPSYPVYVVPEHRTTALRPLKAEEIPYEFQIVPADEYAVADMEYDDDADTSIVSSIASSIWDVLPIPNPITAIKTIASKALSVVKFVITKGSLVLLGAALVVGVCAFTPFCTLIIEKPFAKQIESMNIPYLDDAQHYLREAYNKYHDLY